ncbi:hypothetical protein HDA40_001891 [Hamadaea flava]|uniref:Uncharacterized protein n=1 Tax=Hamadaea flava TaxID=1742688 RepID=A0ABV8LFB6_9ACTN|nr:hypothetical protein [Hamadaea flava]MCP2323384.1 hypothetical protein [Hamadaea flava]
MDAMRVDLGALKAFADELEGNSSKGLVPGLERANREVQTGVRFGAKSVSGEVEAAKQAMTLSLARAQMNAVRMTAATNVLVEAARLIATRYADADLTSAQQLAGVERILAAAAHKAQALYPVPTDTGSTA